MDISYNLIVRIGIAGVTNFHLKLDSQKSTLELNISLGKYSVLYCLF